MTSVWRIVFCDESLEDCSDEVFDKWRKCFDKWWGATLFNELFEAGGFNGVGIASSNYCFRFCNFVISITRNSRCEKKSKIVPIFLSLSTKFFNFVKTSRIFWIAFSNLNSYFWSFEKSEFSVIYLVIF